MRKLGDDPASIDLAAQRLCEGGLVSFPTETVYGLGADAQNGEAVARIYEAKGRPRFNPLIVHVTDLRQADLYANVNEHAERLAEKFWPGPLTMVLPRRPGCSLSALVSAGHDTVALRAPAHPVARRLLEAARIPVAAPSANPSGCLSPTRAEHVARAFPDLDAILIDGGPCTVGLESTVTDLSRGGTPVILRAGSVTLADIAGVLGAAALPGADTPLLSPGMLSSHYAPRKPLRMNATTAKADEAVLAFGSDKPEGGAHRQNLSPSGDLVEAAANLFDMLHIADRQEVSGIAVAPIPSHGLGEAINDRLSRAAHGD